ncbi:MAG: choice-of-anchor D domain-containing protein [Candidatus Electryonea clarkiae]|nr:choice-of-anchor D domain-containing protein [Candidatus Electryonea clarkiae]MDP8287028.1 choice-of-anchor D domain-containing protein [Candidatus Electryonea clarkiae]
MSKIIGSLSLICILLVGSDSLAEVTLVGGYNTFAPVSDVEVVGDYAYLANYSSSQSCVIVDISNPTSPILASSLTANNPLYSVEISGDYVFLAGFHNRVNIFDISNPAEPGDTSVAVIYLPADDFCLAQGMDIQGDYMFVTTYFDGMFIYDISDPTDPILEGSFDVGRSYNDIDVVGDYAYLGEGSSSCLRIVDISDPSSPTQVGYLPGLVNPLGIEVVGDRVYLGDYWGGFKVVDVSDPTDPELVGSYDTNIEVSCVAGTEDYAFTGGYSNSGAFTVFDVSDPSNPEPVDSYQNVNNENQPVYNCFHEVVIQGEYAYTANQSLGFQIFDISDYTSRPEIEVSTTEIDFGDVEFWRNANQTFTVTNVGNSDLTVSDMVLDGDFYEFDFNVEFVLAAEESQEFSVGVTANYVGEFTGSITISSDDEDNPEVTVDLTTNGVWVSATYLLDRLIDVVYGYRQDGDLNRGQANSLTRQLSNIIRKLNRGQVHPATNQLNAFRNHVSAFVESGVLTGAQGDCLTDEANFVESLVDEYGTGTPQKMAIASDPVPETFTLDQNYPNPFNNITNIRFGLPEASQITIQIFTVQGRLVGTLVDGNLDAGYHNVSWNAAEMSTGMYFIKMHSSSYQAMKKVILIK